MTLIERLISMERRIASLETDNAALVTRVEELESETDRQFDDVRSSIDRPLDDPDLDASDYFDQLED